MYKSSGKGILVRFLISFVFPLVLWDHVPHQKLIIWALANIGTCLISIALLIIYRKKGTIFINRKVNTVLKKGWMFLVGVVAGAPGVYLMPVDSFIHQMFIIFVLCGTVMGAAVTVSHFMSDYIAYTLPILLPLSIRLIVTGSSIHLAMSALIIVFYIMMILSAKTANRVMKDSLKLKYINDDFIEHIRLSEEKFAKAFQSSLIIMAIISLDDGQIIEANQGAEKLLGYGTGMLTGIKIKDLIPAENMGYLEDILKEIKTNNYLIDYELTFRARNGEPRHGLMSANRINIQDSQCVLMVIKDITKLKYTEQALQKSEEKHRSLVENLNDIVYMINRDSAITYVTPNVRSFTGYSPEKLIGLDFRDFLDERDKIKNSGQTERVFSGENITSEFRICTSTGGTIWARTRIRPIIQNGIITGGQGVLVDINDIKETEGALQRSEEKYRQLVENLNDIVYALDTEARIIYITPNIEQISGFSESEILGRKFTEFVYPEDLESRLGQFSKVLQGLQEASEYRFLTRDGEAVWVRTSARQIVSQGKVTGIQGVLVDITDLKETEQALIQAINDAEKATRIKTRFLATMSHEIRTPLNSVAGLVNLAMATESKEKILDYLGSVRVATDHLMNVINDMLDFSRMEAGGVHLESNDFDLYSSVKDVISTFNFKAEELGLEIRLSIDNDVINPVNGDEARFRQILFNLIGNAMKFTSQGSITISVSVAPSDTPGVKMPADGSLVMISVSDTGIGIPEDKIDSVFMSYVQAESNTSRKYGGSGLGLAICREIISLMNGRIDVESTVGRGSTFTFVLPFNRVTGSSDGNTVQENAIPDDEEKQVLNILLAEDNAINAKLVSEILLKTGHRVRHAKNGLEVLEILIGESFDCILMDIEMPFMDGFETSESVRRGSAGEDIRHIPIIAMTAHPFDEIRERCEGVGITTCLSKPVNIHEIGDVIQVAMRPAPTNLFKSII